jgi:hypothetical protein
LRLALALVALLAFAPFAHADTPTPRTSWPYAQWLSTAAPRVPQPRDLYPGTHTHTAPVCPAAEGCTTGFGEIWIAQMIVCCDYGNWRQTYHHEVGHNVNAQEMQAGHEAHFSGLVGHANYSPEAFAEEYSMCALNGPAARGYGITEAEHDAVCGWLERAPWGVRYW